MSIFGSHVCTAVKRGELPLHVTKAAMSGDIEEVTDFLQNGGDINSGDVHGQNLIMTACAAGQSNLLRELVKYPGMHLNNRSVYGMTALYHAVNLGHNECIRILLSTRCLCQVNLRMRCTTKAINIQMTPLQLSAYKRQWNSFSIILQETDIIDAGETHTIFQSAFHDDQWDIIKELLQHDISYEVNFLYDVMQEAYILDLSDIFHTLFQKCVDHNGIQNHLNFLLKVFKRKDWVNLKSLVKIIVPRAKLDVSVAELLWERQNVEMQRMINRETFDEETTNGNLILASLAGCNDEVAMMILDDHTAMHDELTLNYTLLLASINNRRELLPLLLKEKKFSHYILDKAMVLAKEAGNSNLLLKIAIADRASKLFPGATKSGRILIDFTHH